MSFLPDVGQSQHNKKIIQELEERKRRAKSNAAQDQTQSFLNQPTSFNSIQNQLQQQNSLETVQQQPIQNKPPLSSFYNNPNTFGYFINTDSTFGNQILPVLPRF